MKLAFVVWRVQVQQWYGLRAALVVWDFVWGGWEMKEEVREATVGVEDGFVEADETTIWMEGAMAEDWF